MEEEGHDDAAVVAAVWEHAEQVSGTQVGVYHVAQLPQNITAISARLIHIKTTI